MKKTGWCLLIFCMIGLLCLSGCTTAKDRNDAKVHYTLGLSYLREPNYSQALKEFRLAVKYNPNDANIYLALGQNYQLLKAFPDAEKNYRKALSLEEGNPLAQNNLASLYLDMGRWDDAILYFRMAACNLVFQNPEISLAGIGFAHFNKGDYLTAVGDYKKSLEANPNYTPAHLRLAEAYEALGKHELAMSEYLEVTRQVPENASIQYKLGLAAAKAGKKHLAIQAFREVIRIAPDSAEGKQALDNINLLQ